MNQPKYKRTYPEELLAYFRSFLGYWERRLDEVEQRLAAEAWQERAEQIARRQCEAIESGEPYCEDVAELLDPEGIKQQARKRAYAALMEEMRARRKLQGLPELVKWANRIGVTTQTIRNWRNKHEEFDRACEECMEIQRVLLNDGGLSSVYDSRTVIFLLQTVHGMKAVENEDAAAGGLTVNITEWEEKETGDEGKTTDG